jgi:hypothetical protein
MIPDDQGHMKLLHPKQCIISGFLINSTRVFLLSSLIFVYTGAAQNTIRTIAEQSDYMSTSAYEDVRAFEQGLISLSPLIRVETIARSIEGRDIPLWILADPMPGSPDELLNDDRIVVYIQANIHAGEVEGKEAVQMLARDLLKNPPSSIFNHVVLLLCPILNADGNERISTRNRTNQNGPVNGVGVRYNGQFLDLNRDAMKLETPELKGVVMNVLNRWDPALTVDCHTTNGSYHEEPVTFTWMMNPNGDRNLINFMRDECMPAIHKNLAEKRNVENVFYGEFINRLDLDQGWISYAAEPRYMVNYIGIRNRLAILNENYVYADFKTRVHGCYNLLWTTLEYAAENCRQIKILIEEADEKLLNRIYSPGLADSFAVVYKGVPTPEPVTIKAYEADTIPGVQGYWRYKKSDRKKTVSVPYIADYFATKSVPVPHAYLLTVPEKSVVENLQTHGIVTEILEESITLEVDQFNLDTLKGSNRLNQGHYTNEASGSFSKVSKEFAKGTIVIRTAQHLGNLVSYLLEPQSDDSLLKWNFFDRYLVPQWERGFYPYPVFKLAEFTELNTTLLN